MDVALEVVYVRFATFDGRRVVMAMAPDQAVVSMISRQQPTPGAFSYPRECSFYLLRLTYLCCTGLDEVEPCIVAGINRNTLWPGPYPPCMRVVCCRRVEDLYRTF